MAKVKKEEEERFVTVYESGGVSYPFKRVIVDRMTGVQYLYLSGSHTGGPTVFVDRDGKPLLYQPSGE